MHAATESWSKYTTAIIGMFPRIEWPRIECLLYLILQAGCFRQPWSIGVPVTEEKLSASSSIIQGHSRHVSAKKSYHKIRAKSHFSEIAQMIERRLRNSAIPVLKPALMLQRVVSDRGILNPDARNDNAGSIYSGRSNRFDSG